MKVYVIEHQSQYDGGSSEGVFQNKEDAIEYVENKKYFEGWKDDCDEDYLTTKHDQFDFYYCVIEYDLS